MTFMALLAVSRATGLHRDDAAVGRIERGAGGAGTSHSSSYGIGSSGYAISPSVMTTTARTCWSHARCSSAGERSLPP